NHDDAHVLTARAAAVFHFLNQEGLPMAKKKTSVILIHGKAGPRAARQLLLAQNDYKVAAMDQATGLVESYQDAKPDLVVMDSILPDGPDPFAATKKLRQRFSDSKVVFLAASSTSSHINQAAAVGANGMLLNSDSPEAFLQGLRRVAEGEDGFSPELKKRLAKSNGSLASKLSPREREVLCLLARDHSVKDVGLLLGVAPTTVETHRQSIRSKLDVRGAAGMARFAVREGLVEP
ncbi:MAG: response regulator transcription factor, partial [Planctomycetales bacterium]